MKADLSQVRGKIIIPQMAIGSCRDDKYNPIEMLYHHLIYTPVLDSPPPPPFRSCISNHPISWRKNHSL